MKHQKQSDKVVGLIFQIIGLILMLFALSLIYAGEVPIVCLTVVLGVLFFGIGSSIKDTWHE
jgi:uncharacterized membrane protein